MNIIKTYNNFINESLKDKLKGKSENEILNNVKNLTPEEKLRRGVQYGILPLVKQAIEKGVDPSYFDNWAIRYASEGGHLDVVKELMKDDRVDPSDIKNYAIRISLLNGHLDVVKELMKDDRVDPSDENNSSIIFASQKGNLDAVKLFLKDKRVDPSDVNNCAIRYSSQNGHLEIVKELMKDKIVDPSADNNYAIRYASRNGHLEIVKELMKDDRVDPSSGDNFAIKYASQNGHLEIVKELLKDERVINKLSKEELEKYKNQISNLNESLKDKLKGKSDDNIIKSLNDMDVIKRIEKIRRYNLPDKFLPSDQEIEKQYPGHIELINFYNELKKDKYIKNNISFIYNKDINEGLIKFNKGAFSDYILIPDDDQYSFIKIKIYMMYGDFIDYKKEKIIYTGELNYRMIQVIYNQLDI